VYISQLSQCSVYITTVIVYKYSSNGKINIRIFGHPSEQILGSSLKLTFHRDMYIEAKMPVTKIVHNVKSEYFSSKIAKCTNCKQLFHVVDKLLGRNITLPLLTIVSMECLSKLFSTFFYDRVAKIIGHLDSGTAIHDLPSSCSHDVEYQHTPFTFFKPITTENLL